MSDADDLAGEFVLQRSSNGVLIVSADGQIERINPAAAALLNLTVDLIGCPPQECFPDNPALLALFSGESACDVPLPHQRVAAGLAGTLADGRRIVLLEDVTEQRDLDSRREAFVNTMAHDLRNPLAALIGYDELVETLGELNPEQRYYLHRGSDTAVKLHAVAAELVDLAWVEAGMPLKRAPLDLKQAIERVVAELAPLAREKQITIEVSTNTALPAILGDEERIRLVISKILHNAIHYSASGQTVRVRAWGEGQEVFCSFTDQGIGIADDELEMVFDRLYRCRDPRVQALPGGGLGLTIARRIVERHGGDLRAESRLDQGSTFTFALPAAVS